MTKCKGCGSVLQYNDPSKSGYSPKENAEYCQRCFRLRHYDDPMLTIDTTIDNITILDEIQKLDHLIVWVVDGFDFESNILEGINRHFKGKDILLVVTKRDLLPATVGNHKLGNFILSRLKFYDIKIQGLVVVGEYGKDGREEVLNAIEQYRDGRDVVVMGLANAGKSTLINALVDSSQLTMSRYPGTTLDFSTIPLEGYSLVDTPGLNNPHSILWHIESKHLKEVLPTKVIKPTVFQLKEPQSYAIGGIARIDVYPKEASTAVFYCSNRIPLHRGKVEQADKLWKQHYTSLLKPILQLPFVNKGREIKVIGDKFDVVIDGLGWVCLQGKIDRVVVYINPQINCISREAMV